MQTQEAFPRLSAEEYIENQSDVWVKNRTVKNRFSLHCHDFFEIEIILRGRGTHVFNGISYPIEAGCSYLIKPTDIHEIVADGELEICNIVFRETMISETVLFSVLQSDLSCCIRLTGRELDSMIMAARILANECKGGGNYRSGMLEYLIHFFTGDTGKTQASGEISGIKRALLYLEVHFREQIDLSVLAKEAGFHPMYFSAVFKKTTGESYVQRLTSLRLAYAATLLKNNCSVSYACFESGFGSLSNFFTAFKKKYGVSPKEYVRGKKKPAENNVRCP